VDELSGRLYALTPSGEVVLLKEYESYRRQSARDAAITFWGDPANWAPIDERIISCECPGCEVPRRDWSSAWRITSITDGTIKAKILMVSDHGIRLLGDEHTMYTSPHLPAEERPRAEDRSVDNDGPVLRARSIDIDTYITMIERFGEPCDMATGEIRPPYLLMYRST
jgi:hypothetical protein